MATNDSRGVRRSTSSAVGGVSAQFNSNEFDEQITAQGMPPYAEMTRLGDGWSAIATSAVAALVVRPSTVCGFEIYNGYAAGGKSLIIDRLFSQELVTSTTGLGGGSQIWAQVYSKAAPTDGSFTIRGNSGKAYGGSVICAAGTTVVASGWFPWGPTVKKESAGAVVPGGGLWVEVGGRLVVPPQAALCIQVVSGYVADTFCSGAGWYERIISTQ